MMPVPSSDFKQHYNVWTVIKGLNDVWKSNMCFQGSK